MTAAKGGAGGAGGAKRKRTRKAPPRQIRGARDEHRPESADEGEGKGKGEGEGKGKGEGEGEGRARPVAVRQARRTAGKVPEVAADGAGETYKLRLYVTGATPRSTRAIENIRTICEEHLQGRYTLEVIDVYQQPELAQSENIIAMPTLVKQLPVPLRRLVGDLSKQEKVLLKLDIQPS